MLGKKSGANKKDIHIAHMDYISLISAALTLFGQTLVPGYGFLPLGTQGESGY